MTVATYVNGDGQGNDTVKWEIFPLQDDTKSVKIFSFSDPNYPEFRTFEKEVPVNEEYTIIHFTEKRLARRYYYLLFDDSHFEIVSQRFLKMDSVVNFRDLGGYTTADKKSVRWGKFYRSGRLNLSDKGKELFNSLRIRTVIDLRSKGEQLVKSKPVNANMIHIPVNACNISEVVKLLKNNKFKQEEARQFMEEAYISLAKDYTKEFSNMFEFLLDSLNYPVLVECNMGSDRCSFASALVLLALGVSYDQIVEDYLSTNSVLNVRQEGSYAYKLMPEAQEAVTTLLLPNRSLIDLARREIISSFGSMDNYFTNALNLDSMKRERLKALLLTSKLVIDD
ncbi:MAG: tyrosine-protein phosphatase [Bacteroidales bacterium]|nr:tyrosine-protein phosphatase [Bacteroidales bacterium]